MPEIFNPVDDLIAEQALVDALVADFTEDDWNRMASQNNSCYYCCFKR